MRVIKVHIVLVLISCLAFGCDFAKTKNKNKVVKVNTFKRIESPELAKLILKPKYQKISIGQDPFKPLIQQDFKKVNYESPMNTQRMRDFRFLGVAKINDEYVAYLKEGTKRGTYRLDDKVKDYTIKRIQPDRVIMSNGAQTITLKRGVLN